MSDAPEREDLLAMEEDILRGLLDAAEERKRAEYTVQIYRKGELKFSFRIRPLLESEYEECRREATRYEPVKRLGGLMVPVDTDAVHYRNLLIYRATVPEDRKRLWDNKKAWELLGVASGPDMINEVLLAGEKDQIVEKIDELSGYGQNRVQVIKN